MFLVLLNLGYFLAANFRRKIVPPPATGNFSKFLYKKTKYYASNEIGMKEVAAHLGTIFLYSLDVNLGKMKKLTLELIFFKNVSLEHLKKNEWKIRFGKPFKKV